MLLTYYITFWSPKISINTRSSCLSKLLCNLHHDLHNTWLHPEWILKTCLSYKISIPEKSSEDLMRKLWFFKLMTTPSCYNISSVWFSLANVTNSQIYLVKLLYIISWNGKMSKQILNICPSHMISSPSSKDRFWDKWWPWKCLEKEGWKTK